MKYYKKILYIYFFLFFMTFNVYGHEKTAFIDLDLIIKNSNIGKAFFSKIDMIDSNNVKNLEVKNQQLKDLEIKIKKKQNILSAEAFEKEVNLFKEKIKIYNDEKNTMVKDFNELKKKELNNILIQITPIIQDYMSKNSISILLDKKNIFMSLNETNITNEILNEINNQIK